LALVLLFLHQTFLESFLWRHKYSRLNLVDDRSKSYPERARCDRAWRLL